MGRGVRGRGSFTGCWGVTPGGFLGIYLSFWPKIPGIWVVEFTVFWGGPGRGGPGHFFAVPQTPRGPLFWVFTVFLEVFGPGVLQCGFPIFGRSTINSFLFLGDRLRLGTSTELNY